MALINASACIIGHHTTLKLYPYGITRHTQHQMTIVWRTNIRLRINLHNTWYCVAWRLIIKMIKQGDKPNKRTHPGVGRKDPRSKRTWHHLALPRYVESYSYSGINQNKGYHKDKTYWTHKTTRWPIRDVLAYTFSWHYIRLRYIEWHYLRKWHDTTTPHESHDTNCKWMAL
jgi:hypothetical protein